jgi:hypothetical protein
MDTPLPNVTRVTVSGKAYIIGKMDVFTQFDVARKMAPVVARSVPMLALIRDVVARNASVTDLIDQVSAAMPMLDAIAGMSSQDSAFILASCLKTVSRSLTGGNGFVAIINPGGGLQFEDISLPDMMQLVWKVLEVNLMGFMSGSPSS